MKKDVRIIGLTVNNQVGIIKAHSLKFDDKNRLIVFKGGVGEGKTTEQKILQLGTQGSKTLTDKNLYGDVDVETQLVDGESNIWVGCKIEDGKIQYVLYTKDEEGKKVGDPVIDGVKATPAKYLQALQTELTWNMDKLTSENPTVQRDILLKLYQHEFQKLGVVFDKKSPLYKDSILGKITEAEKDRDLKDAQRKQVGGIKEDLKLQGFDIDRPETIPEYKSLIQIDADIQNLHTEIAVAKSKTESDKEAKLLKIKTAGVELVNQCNNYNAELKQQYQESFKKYQAEEKNQLDYEQIIHRMRADCDHLHLIGGLTDSAAVQISELLHEGAVEVPAPEMPKEPTYIRMSDDKKIVVDFDPDNYTGKAKELVQKVYDTKLEYKTVLESSPQSVNTSAWENKITVLEEEKATVQETNKIFVAVEAYHAWAKANEQVVQLKKQYRDLLMQVDTGVEGLKIVPENDDLFLMYDGSWDAAYFNNEHGELRKVSSYSGTQKPVICLLIQNYLLNRKPKAMRYMYIDNLPIDNKTRALLERMCNELDLRIFLNITGDFTRDTLQNGEVLIEGGEVFFN
jgi:uncharacterized protein (UPF0335 family)